MPTTCNIEFESNPSCTFYGDQILTTNISLNLDAPKEFKGIAFKIYGTGRMYWSIDDDENYSGEEDYINIKTFLLGTPKSEPVTLKAGEHKFTYSYHLPLTCPSSVESQYGQIRYRVTVILIRSWKLDKTFSKKFTILKLVDLNYEPNISYPVKKELEKKINSTTPLLMSVSLPQSGYVPGQNIPVNVTILNESGKIIKGLKISLVMIASCYNTGQFKKTIDCMTKISKLKKESLENQNELNSIYELPVPPTPPSDNKFSNIIHVSYQLEVEAVMSTMQPNQVVILPIFIGNVPIMEHLKRPQPSSIIVTSTDGKAINNSSASDSKQILVTPPWQNEAIHPPTYEAATFMPVASLNEDEENDLGDIDFIPRYPVFNVPVLTTPKKQ